MPVNLTKLVCGTHDDFSSELGEILNHLKGTIETTVGELLTLGSLNDERVSFFGPFLGRSMLELGCTAIIARIDPFRVLILREAQSKPDYRLGDRRKSSIQWQGDVIAEKISNDPWSDSALKQPTRALLGDYYEHIFWKSAVQRLIDSVPDHKGGEWLAKIRRIGPEGFCNHMRSEIQRLYSALSKGIHHEFMIPTASILDRATVSDLSRDSLFIVASLGLALTTIPHAPFVISLDKAVMSYENLQNLEMV